jgi:hypothetical protein
MTGDRKGQAAPTPNELRKGQEEEVTLETIKTIEHVSNVA